MLQICFFNGFESARAVAAGGGTLSGELRAVSKCGVEMRILEIALETQRRILTMCQVLEGRRYLLQECGVAGSSA